MDPRLREDDEVEGEAAGGWARLTAPTTSPLHRHSRAGGHPVIRPRPPWILTCARMTGLKN